MNIDIRDIITLDDNKEYVVISIANYQNKIYYYLIDQSNAANVKFCLENSKKNSLIEIKDSHLIQALLPLFANNVKNYITEY